MSSNSTNSTYSWGPPFSNNQYAPDIPYWLYFAEKTNFAGFLIGAIFYGITIVLFFQCLGAIFSTANRAKGGTKWGLLGYVGAMFSFVTIYTAMDLNLQSISYIDNREFPGIDGKVPPGPLGYQYFLHDSGLTIVPNLMFIFCSWLANALLLYRCYALYALNHYVVLGPFVLWLGSFATGLWFIYQTSRPDGTWNLLPVSGVPYSHIGVPFFTMTAGVNVLLTLLIAARLISHGKNVRNVMGASNKLSAFYKAFLAIVLESCAMYAVNSLLFVIPWGIESYVANIFLPILAQIQVIGPFFIVVRMAGHTALTNRAIVTGVFPGSVNSTNTKNQEKSIGGGIIPGTPSDLGSNNVVATIDFSQGVQGKV